MKSKKIKISDIKKGMKIKTFDPETGKDVFKPVEKVLNTFIPDEEQVCINLSNDMQIYCSVTHPILVKTKSGMEEKLPPFLENKDVVICDNQKIANVINVEIDKNTKTNDYIDISVEGTNTFYCSNNRNGQMSLTHNSQGGIRGGAATTFYPFFHTEFENLIVLKNNKGIDENRVRHMDYCIQLNRLAYQRLIEGKKITFFSPQEVPDLMEAFYRGDNDEFEKLYEKYERSRKLKMKYSLSAIDVFGQIMDERTSTGRIYIQNIDHCNTQSSFDQNKYPIEQSNLCMEIQLPTKPFQNLDDEEGLIGLCTLSAINWGNIKKVEDFEKPCELAVRALDALLTYQDYPMIQAEIATKKFRTLGIGIINLAYFLAKNNIKYDDSAFEKVHECIEAMSYYLIKASVQLAKEYGPCESWKDTKYGQGLFPWDVRKKDVDKIVPNKLNMDWESLRKDMKKYGIRNATNLACMPSESSAQLANATNGIEPPRGLISEKASKDGVLKQVVPEIYHLKNKYDLLWDQKSPDGYLKIACILQAFIDQSISTNVSINPENYEDGKIPLKELLKQLLEYYKYGGKTLYYHNTYDGSSDEPDDKKNENSERLLEEIIEEPCDSCVL